jgi:hypothetical protein
MRCIHLARCFAEAANIDQIVNREICVRYLVHDLFEHVLLYDLALSSRFGLGLSDMR